MINLVFSRYYSFFKKQKISIKSMFQLDNKIKNIVPLIFVTHKIEEKKLVLY